MDGAGIGSTSILHLGRCVFSYAENSRTCVGKYRTSVGECSATAEQQNTANAQRDICCSVKYIRANHIFKFRSDRCAILDSRRIHIEICSMLVFCVKSLSFIKSGGPKTEAAIICNA